MCISITIRVVCDQDFTELSFQPKGRKEGKLDKQPLKAAGKDNQEVLTALQEAEWLTQKYISESDPNHNPNSDPIHYQTVKKTTPIAVAPIADTNKNKGKNKRNHDQIEKSGVSAFKSNRHNMKSNSRTECRYNSSKMKK